MSPTTVFSRTILSFLVALVLSSSLSASAGIRDVGNGGIGIVQERGNLVYLYDFVESGVEKDPFMDPSIRPDPKVTERLKRALWQGAPVAGVASKLAEISRRSKLLSILLMREIESHTWALVEEELDGTFDVGPSPIHVDPLRLVQIANRNGGLIRIQSGVWNKLPPMHQIGLILHEAMYSFFDVTYSLEAKYLFDPDKFSLDIRGLSLISRGVVGYIFSPRWGTDGREGFRRALLMNAGGSYPYLVSLLADEPLAIKESADGRRISVAPRIGFWLAGRGAEYRAKGDSTYDVFLDLNTPLETKLDQICWQPDASVWVMAYWKSDTLILNESGFTFMPQEMVTLGEYSGPDQVFSGVDTPIANGKRKSISCRDWASRILAKNRGRYDGFHY